jgi:hypothetical protein
MDCTECNGELHEHLTTRWNCEDEPVCESCADLLPSFVVSYSEHLRNGEWYGVAEHKGCEISTAWTEDRRVAKKAIIDMCRKLWGENIKPVEEA